MKKNKHAIVNSDGIKKGVEKYNESNSNGVVLNLFMDIINKIKGDTKRKIALVAKIGSADTKLNTKEDAIQQVIINKVLLSTLLSMPSSHSREVSNLIPLCNCLMNTDEWLYLVEHNVLPFITK